jgi:penicillin amidase
MTVLHSPDGPVEVTFDPARRPAIIAGTWDAAAYGLGWACAVHRRTQLDRLRRVSQGRLAELVGPAALAADIRQRTLGLAAVATACWAALPPHQQRLLDIHAAGINAGTSEVTGGSDPDLPRWQPTDTIAVAQQMFQSLISDGADNRMVEVLRRTLPAPVADLLLDPAEEFATDIDGSCPAAEPAPLPLAELRTLMAEPVTRASRIVVRDGRPAGSNAWAVASAGGPIVLANDMHLELTDPSLLYAARLVLPGGAVTGVTLPGLPMLIAGSNGVVAWGFTRLPADVCELRDIEEGPVPGTYLADGIAEPFRIRREVISVRGGADTVLQVRETRWGPVTGELAGRPVTFFSSLTDPSALDFGLLRVHRARSADEAADILAGCGLPPLNAVVADSGGRVLWTVTGRYRDWPGTGPRGFATAERPSLRAPDTLPRRLAGSGGYVVTCNNGNPETRAAGLGWNFFPGCRARRAADELTAGRGHDIAGSAALQLDLDASYFDFYRDLALRYLAAARSPRLIALRAEVSAWRGTADRDEYGLALLVTFRDLIREEMIAAVTRPCQRYDDQFAYCYNGYERTLRRLLGALDDGLVPAPWREPGHFVLGQLLAARTLLTRYAGTDEPVRWGAANRIVLTTAADGIELSGCAESLRVALPGFGAAVRLVADLAQPDAGVLTIPGAADGTDTPRHLTRWADGVTDPLVPAPAPAVAPGRPS